MGQQPSTLELRVRERDAQPRTPGEVSQPDVVQMKLSLPGLGDLGVNLMVGQHSVSCHFSAGSAFAEALLTASSDELVGRLKRLGFAHTAVDATHEPLAPAAPAAGRRAAHEPRGHEGMSDRPLSRHALRSYAPRPGTAPVEPGQFGCGRPSSAVQTPPATGRRAEPRRAVALTYDPANADAPVVTAAGQGAVAEEIIRRAREAGVPVTEDPRLAAVLSQIDVGRVIPPELYQVIAEVLAYVYRLDERGQPNGGDRG